MGKGGECQFTRAALRFPTHWTGGRPWSLEAHSRYRGEHPLSVFASRFSLAVGRLLSPIVASKWLVVHGWRSAEALGFLSFTPLFPRARPPPPTSPASHLPSPPSRPICHTPPTSGHLERSPPQSPQQPPSTPQTPARNCKYPAACLRPTLHNTTGSPPPGVALHHTPFCASDFFRPRPSPSSSKAGLHCGACSAAECAFTGRSRLVCSRFSCGCGCRCLPHRLLAVSVGRSCRCRRRPELHRPPTFGDSRQNKHTAESHPQQQPTPRRQHQGRGPGRIDSRRNHDNRHVVERVRGCVCRPGQTGTNQSDDLVRRAVIGVSTKAAAVISSTTTRSRPVPDLHFLSTRASRGERTCRPTTTLPLLQPQCNPQRPLCSQHL